MEYLKALNNIFERTLLGRKTRVFKPDGLSIQRLNQGFSFFEEWAEELVVNGSFECGVDSKEFISWQVCRSYVQYIHLYNNYNNLEFA